MKPHDVQRAVKAHRFDRSAGDAPSLGRVERMPRLGARTRRRRKRSEESKKNRPRRRRRRVIGLWSVVFALLSLSALAGVMWLWLQANKNRAAAVATEVAAPLETRVVSKFQSPTEDEALDLVKRAMLIRDEEAVPRFFRTGGVSGAEIVNFLRTMHETDGEVSQYDWLSSMDANGLLIDGVTVVTRTGRNRLAMLTPDDKGRWRIDFEAFARAVKPSWHELLEGGAGRGVVRVIVAEDSYFNGPFREEEVWNCYGMASPDADVVLTGYCRKRSPQAAAMERILKEVDDQDGGKSLKRATLEIRRVEGAGPRQFEISRVLAQDWVMAAKAYDEAFK